MVYTILDIRYIVYIYYIMYTVYYLSRIIYKFIEIYRVYVRFYTRALRGWRDILRDQESEYYLKAGWPRKWVHSMVLK